MARELLRARVLIETVIELMADRLSERSINQIARELVIDDDVPGPSLGLALLERSKSAAANQMFLSHYVNSLSEEPPEELLCPLMMTLMTDPVTISSGYVLNRASVYDEARGLNSLGALSRKTC